MDANMICLRTAQDWVKLAQSEPDDEGACLACNVLMGLDDGCDPTPLCHHCAQEAVETMAAALSERDARVARLEGALRAVSSDLLQAEITCGPDSHLVSARRFVADALKGPPVADAGATTCDPDWDGRKAYLRRECAECGDPGTRHFSTEGDGNYWLCDKIDESHGEHRYGGWPSAAPVICDCERDGCSACAEMGCKYCQDCPNDASLAPHPAVDEQAAIDNGECVCAVPETCPHPHLVGAEERAAVERVIDCAANLIAFPSRVSLRRALNKALVELNALRTRRASGEGQR